MNWELEKGIWKAEIPKDGINCINVEVVDCEFEEGNFHYTIKKATAWIDRTEYQLDLSHVETYSQLEQDIGDSLENVYLECL